MSRSRRSRSSSKLTLALNMDEPLPSSTIGSDSTSSSSRISPTISSSRSSMVTSPAVLVDDDRHLHLLALELLEQLRHALGLGHERRGPDERHDRIGVGPAGV